MADALSIVIIDDNPGSLELLSAALAHSDAAVYTASNPLAGLEIGEKASSAAGRDGPGDAGDERLGGFAGGGAVRLVH